MSFVRTPRPGKRLGRKPSKDSGVSHAKRAELSAHHPVHVTLKWCEGLPTLREGCAERILLAAFRIANAQEGLRVTAYSIQSNHVHLICEADDRATLSTRMQGMKVRIAHGLNKLWGREGSVFADRYHREDLTTPRQVRNCIRYVLQNVFRHRVECDVPNRHRPDPYSSGKWFTGWREAELTPDEASLASAPVAKPGTWLLKTGWRKHGGRLSILDRPAGACA